MARQATLCAHRPSQPVANWPAATPPHLDTSQSQDDIIKTASNAAATAAVEARNANIPVVAFDLAGPEAVRSQEPPRRLMREWRVC